MSGFDFRGSVPNRSSFLAVLIGADFQTANLSNCVLAQTDWVSANLRSVKLTGADMRRGNFYSTDFRGADLTGADLRHAKLNSAYLIESKLDDANVSGARFGTTTIGNVDLSKVCGLDETLHISPSIIGADTLRRTADGLADAGQDVIRAVVTFFDNAGLDEEIIQVFRGWIGKPLRYHSAFLSHSSLDKTFARRLYRDLRASGISCWFDEKQLLPGDSILDEVDRGIRLWDKLILICSKNSLDPRTGWWVREEVERALAKERELARSSGQRASVLVPVMIDDELFDCSHPLKATILERSVGDFRGWNDPRLYAEALARLVAALNSVRRSSSA